MFSSLSSIFTKRTSQLPNTVKNDNTKQLQDLELGDADLRMASVKGLLQADLDACINRLKTKQTELTSIDNTPWSEYLKNEIKKLPTLPTEAEKALVSAIGLFNAYRRVNYDPSQKSSYPCGSATCKNRGDAIKEALITLSTYSPESLGALGMLTVAKNTTNWGVRGVTGVAGNMRSRFQPSPMQPNQLDPTMQPSPMQPNQLDPSMQSNPMQPQYQPMPSDAQSLQSSLGGRRTRRR